jgi:hypothetical protein
MDVTFSAAISQVQTVLTARVWQNQRYKGKDIIKMTPTCWNEIRGDIYSKTVALVGSTNNLKMSRKKQEISVQFYLRNTLPVGGTVLISFPSGMKAYPHCRSMVNLGSKLTAIGSAYNG